MFRRSRIDSDAKDETEVVMPTFHSMLGPNSSEGSVNTAHGEHDGARKLIKSPRLAGPCTGTLATFFQFCFIVQVLQVVWFGGYPSSGWTPTRSHASNVEFNLELDGVHAFAAQVSTGTALKRFVMRLRCHTLD